VTARARQQLSPLMAIQPSKRFIEQSETHAAFQQSSSKANPLALPARNQAAAFSQFRLQSIGQFSRSWRSSACSNKSAVGTPSELP